MKPAPSQPPLSLYVHIPWCVRKCPYCDFNSHAVREEIPQREYIDALLADLDVELAHPQPARTLLSVFIGGGTPSLFDPDHLGRLLDGIRQRIDLPAAAEVTLEANPGSVERGRFAEYRAAGINRLSIGVQSFNDAQLGRLGRIHGRQDAVRAAEAAHACGLDNFNLDLMYGLPAQTDKEALHDLNEALALSPAHLSWYQLTLEPNTAFFNAPPPLPDNDALWAMQLAGQRLLAERGYAQYEVSAYATEGRQCRHNLNYWEFGDYLGIGAGAHGKISGPTGIQRRWKLKHPAEYLQHAAAGALSGSCLLEARDIPFEFLLNALRLNAGFTPERFQQRTGMGLDRLAETLEHAREDGLLEFADQRWRATERGRSLLDDVLARFLPEP